MAEKLCVISDSGDGLRIKLCVISDDHHNSGDVLRQSLLQYYVNWHGTQTCTWVYKLAVTKISWTDFKTATNL